MESRDVRARILDLARAEGFELVRFAAADDLVPEREAALEAQAAGLLDGLDWITAGWIEHATSPRRFLAGAKTVVLFALPCHAPDPQLPAGGPARGKVARYARGRDYHRVFQPKLRRIARILREECGASATATVDYGPVLERPLAARAGLGWFGKSTMLLAPGLGPWVMLGAIVTDLVVEPDAPLRKSCGSCTRCITACPTGAISADGGRVDTRLCISYHTIENRGVIPRELRAKFGAWVFGCDDCLDSCPVGASNGASHPAFEPPHPDAAFPPLVDLLAMDDAAFDQRFRGTAVTRAKREGMARNACVALGNIGGPADLGALVRALDDASALVRGHAAWAIGALGGRFAPSRAAAADALAARTACEGDAWVREEIHAAQASFHTA